MMTSAWSAGKAIVFGGVVALAMALAACSSAQSSGSAAAEGTAAGGTAAGGTAAGGTAAGGTAAEGTAVGGSRPVVSVPGMSCAWPTELSAQTDNVAFPDAAEEIFGQPIVASAGTRIVLAGRFPDARYVSVQVYTPDGVGASLTDYRIAPQPGNLNPWQRPGPPGGRFTVTLRSDSTPGQPNTLPLPVGTTSQHTGYLVYRVYLPAGGASAVPVPVLTIDQGGVSRVLPACPSHNAAVTFPAVSGSGSSTAPPPELEFFKPAQSTFNNGGLANVDTSYLLAYLARPPAADVVVVTAKAPTFAPGSHPSPWPARGDGVRYWSMCVGVLIRSVPLVANELPGGGTDYGCRADEATRLNAAGDYTYVIGSESQRATISRVPGVTFLPFSTTYPAGPYLLGLRNVLVSTSFAHSPQKVTQAEDPAAAAAVMGPYYPRAAVCPLSTLTAHGPRACQGNNS